MRVKILKDVRYALGGIDVRDFAKGQEIDIKEEYAYRMIDLKLAVDPSRVCVDNSPVGSPKKKVEKKSAKKPVARPKKAKKK